MSQFLSRECPPAAERLRQDLARPRPWWAVGVKRPAEQKGSRSLAIAIGDEAGDWRRVGALRRWGGEPVRFVIQRPRRLTPGPDLPPAGPPLSTSCPILRGRRADEPVDRAWHP